MVTEQLLRMHARGTVPVRKGSLVQDKDGLEGVVVAFKTQTLWSFRRPSKRSWAIVELDEQFGGHRVLYLPADLYVLTRKPREGEET